MLTEIPETINYADTSEAHFFFGHTYEPAVPYNLINRPKPGAMLDQEATAPDPSECKAPVLPAPVTTRRGNSGGGGGGGGYSQYTSGLEATRAGASAGGGSGRAGQYAGGRAATGAAAAATAPAVVAGIPPKYAVTTASSLEDFIPGMQVTDYQTVTQLRDKVKKMLGADHLRGFPGAQVVSLDGRNLFFLADRRLDYRVTWKADGVRYMMLITKVRGRGWGSFGCYWCRVWCVYRCWVKFVVPCRFFYFSSVAG